MDANFIAHFTGVSDDLKHYVIDVALEESRYLFVWRKKKVQIAYCSHCKSEYTVSGELHKHNEHVKCEMCNSDVIVKSHGMGRKHLVDQAYVIWYEKSQSDSNAIVATWYLASRDYNGDYRQVDTEFQPLARYLFESDKGGTMYKRTDLIDWDTRTIETVWTKRKRISPLPMYVGYYAPKIYVYVSYDSIENSVKGTYFSYLPWREFGEPWTSQLNSWSLIEYFALAAKYPSVEYLSKMGLKQVIAAKMHDRPTYNCVYWRGKSIEKVLRMNKSDLRELRNIASSISPRTLHSLQYWRKIGLDVDFKMADQLAPLTDKQYYGKSFKELSRLLNIEPIRIIRYLLKQSNHPEAPRRYQEVSSVFGEWQDYLNECNELGIDIHQNLYLFPNNLHAAHEKTMKRVKIKRDESLNRIIAKRAAELEQFVMENGQFVIRPAQSSKELFVEGKALQHCIGGYARKYAVGETEIYLVRLTNQPNEPFVTVEVVTGKLIQVRGMKNSVPAEEVVQFVHDFIHNMAKIKRQRNKKQNQIAS